VVWIGLVGNHSGRLGYFFGEGKRPAGGLISGPPGKLDEDLSGHGWIRGGARGAFLSGADVVGKPATSDNLMRFRG